MNEISRMRTINEAINLIKETDPNSAITYNFIKQLVKGNKVRNFQSGNRTIINFDDLIKLINGNMGE